MAAAQTHIPSRAAEDFLATAPTKTSLPSGV